VRAASAARAAPRGRLKTVQEVLTNEARHRVAWGVRFRLICHPPAMLRERRCSRGGSADLSHVRGKVVICGLALASGIRVARSASWTWRVRLGLTRFTVCRVPSSFSLGLSWLRSAQQGGRYVR
jgi:hypothetical protein